MAKFTWKSTRSKIAAFGLTPGLASRVEGMVVQLEEAGVPAPKEVASADGTVRFDWANADTLVSVGVHKKAPTSISANTSLKRLASVKLIIDALS